jgi:hypothetical protein
LTNKEDRNNYADVFESIAFDLRFGEDVKQIAESLRLMANAMDPPKKKYSYNPADRLA